MNRGAQAEEVAAQYLQQHGLRLISRNYRCRFGEIDLILQDSETLVFAEVRLRSSKQFGGAAASIDTRKQDKLIRSAQHYLATLSRLPPCRFDAVLLGSPGRQARPPLPNPLPFMGEDANVKSSLQRWDIEWVKNAFGA